MCHTIYSQKSWRFGSFGDYLIGNKVFKNSPRQVISPLCNHKFKFNRTHIGLCCKEEPVNQEVEFRILADDVKDGRIEILVRRQDLKAGIHISPLFYSSGNMKDYTNIEIPSHLYIDIFSIPVFFHKYSIVFYDSYDVSVDRFCIVNPTFFSSWLISMQSKMEWDETYLNKFAKWYTNIYEWIEESI